MRKTVISFALTALFYALCLPVWAQQPAKVHRIGYLTVTVVRAAAIFFLVTILSHGGAATAAEVKVFTSRAIATVLDKIGPEFERTTGHKLNVISGFSPNFVKQINAGEPFDVVVSPPRTIDGLIKEGKVIADTRTNLVRSGLGVGVRAAPMTLSGCCATPNRSAISRAVRYSNWSIGLEFRRPSSRK